MATMDELTNSNASPAYIETKSKTTVTYTQCSISSEDDNEAQSSEDEETIDHSKLLPIPSPPTQSYFGLLGHLPDLDRTLPVRSYWQFMDEYSPIFSLQLGVALPRVFVGSRELVNEMADDSRFIKYTHRLHQMMRPVFGDGLFSAESTSKAWGKAHRLLKPALGPIGLSKMFDDMQDISAQLVLKWDRMGDVEIECIKDMSSLTFDTIGLCAYGYRFNEFYSPDPHPFNTQLNEAIVESGRRANRPDLLNLLYYKEEAHRQENIVKMRALCSSIIQDRIDNPKPDAKDLLNVMINGVDRETGEQLGFENVMYQIPTLLGGGYETTTSTLCFIYYFMCNNPETMRKAQQEVDDIVGNRVLQYDMLRNLKYLDACMKEALRLQHPVSLLTRFAVKDTVVGGKYLIKKGQMISGIWRHFHRDPKVWGEDADTFRPERMLDVNFQTLPENAWKPFGDGMRACIGRGFAEQEILINMAMVLQKFDMEKVDPSYELKLKGQMGVKPVDFKIRVRRRPGRGLMFGIPGGGVEARPTKVSTHEQQQHSSQGATPKVRRSISVLWGGNMGTTDSLVQMLSKYAGRFGLDMEIQELDDAVENISTDKPVVIITPSYEGRPPDNAKKFVAWLEKLAAKKSHLPPGIKYAVFGVGNSDWVHTFHRVPRLIDDTLSMLGCERIMDVDFANVKRDLAGPWESWSEKLCLNLSGAMKEELLQHVGVEVEISSSKTNATQTSDGEHMSVGVIVASSELADASVGAPKRHVEVRLPRGITYKSGDYLVVQGRNSDEAVSRVLRRFDLTAGDLMTVRSSTKDFLPARAVSIENFLRSTVELATPITRKQLTILIQYARDGSNELSRLREMHEEVQYQNLLNKRYSILDVLDELPGFRLQFGVYIDLLVPVLPRPYSISSSPAHHSADTSHGLIASLTFDVFRAPSWSGHGNFHGVTSSYLAECSPGDGIQCLVRPTKLAFHLPTNPRTPIIMQAAGTGIAPMRALLQERAALKRGSSLIDFGPTLFFFGCRNPDMDFLYRSELAAWEKEGIVEVIPCFSRPGSRKLGRYVADALWEHRDRIWDLFFNSGAHVYTCGSAARLGQSSAAMWRRIWMEKTGKSETESQEWLDQMRISRYISDVW